MATLTFTVTPDSPSTGLPVTSASVTTPDASLPLLIEGATAIFFPGQTPTVQQVVTAMTNWMWSQARGSVNAANQGAAAAAASAAQQQI